MQPAAEDDGGADATVQPDQHEVLRAERGAAVLLGDGGEVHVVLEGDGAPEVLPQRREQAPMPARQVPGERDLAALRIDQAGRAEHDPADAVDRRASLAGRLDDGGVHDLDRVVALADRDVGAPDDPARDVRHAGHDVLRAGLDADDVCGRGDHGVHLGVGSPAAGLLADALHEPPLLEALHQLGCGDLGQSGQLSELSAGQRTLAEQQLERGAVVERAQQSRGAGKTSRTHGDVHP
ncbi:hypothetical protein GCM10027610_135400 [Dactylosporangium cerinum]